MNSIRTRFNGIILVILFSVLVRSCLILAVMYNNNNPVDVMYGGDSPRYFNAAMHFFENTAYSSESYDKSYFRDVPGYPLFLAIFFKIFASSSMLFLRLAQIVFNILFFSLSVIVLYKIASVLFCKRVGIFSAIIYSFYPSLLTVSLLPNPDSLFLFLFLSSVYFLVLFMKKGRNLDLIFMIVFMALSALTREIGIFIPLVMMFLIFFKYIGSWGRYIRIVFLSLIIYMVILAPYFIYNYKFLGQLGFSRKTYIYINFLNKQVKNQKNLKNSSYIYHGKITYFSVIKNYFEKRRHFFAGTGTISMLRILGYDVSEVKEIPKTQKEFLDFLSRKGYEWIAFQWFAWIFVGIVYVASLLSILYLAIRRQFLLVIFFAAFIFYFLVVHFFHYSTRYFTSIVPFLSILSAYFASYVIKPKSLRYNYEN